ncbi:MAG TPA: hypothetical protein VEX11_06575, partial [Acetobacteraceae bacterium]|nr:hypothetical protein [Acetobacteraceae bacterium]
RGRAAPALADHRPINRITTIDFVHAGLHRSGLPSDKWVSRETGCSSVVDVDVMPDHVGIANGPAVRAVPSDPGERVFRHDWGRVERRPRRLASRYVRREPQ